MGLHHLRFIKCNFIENWYQSLRAHSILSNKKAIAPHKTIHQERCLRRATPTQYFQISDGYLALIGVKATPW
jgi:hypothetical protein